MRQYSPLTTFFYLLGPILIILSHFGALLVFQTSLSWGVCLWILFLYGIRMLAITAIYHRLVTHKSYQVAPPILWVGCLLAASAGQMGPSWWKAHHLSHHQNADQKFDPHSPYQANYDLPGFYWSQGGWLLSPHFFPGNLAKDIEKNWILKIIDRLHFVPFVALGSFSYFMGGLPYLSGFFLSTTLLFHGVQTVNSFAHLQGKQPFETKDCSRNNAIVALLTLGEGWHNLHHAFPSSCRQGITSRNGEVAYLFDPTFRFIKLLEFLNLATKLKIPTETKLVKRAKYSILPSSQLTSHN